jgi:chemotaxis protein methyltransferase CheR
MLWPFSCIYSLQATGDFLRLLFFEETEQMLTAEEFKLFKNLIYEESGMYLAETKLEFLEHRLMKRMRATNTTTPYWYYRFLIENRKTELLVLLDILTINETSFFRNGPQFELFRNIVLPDVIGQREREGLRKLRIWSAGCSTGEEPYSIAMTVLDTVQYPDIWDIRIYASDLSLHVLEAAHKGVYAASRVNETVPAQTLQKYFDPEGDAYRVKEAVRRLVVFDYHNLKHENGMSGLDVIFCRNVMIYFDEEEQKRLANKFYRSLAPGGYFLIGHAESLHGWNLDFRFIHDNKGTAYKKDRKGGAL